jgi:hypothetical protein
MMSEKVIGSEFDGFLWGNEYNVDSRTYTQSVKHAYIADSKVCKMANTSM